MTVVLGYLDAGSGSLILQLILGGVAALAVSLKLGWHRLLEVLRIRRREPTGDSERAGP